MLSLILLLTPRATAFTAQRAEIFLHFDQKASITSACFSPDGDTILSASRDSTVRLWDVATGALLRIMVGHESLVNSASFSPDGATIVSASDDNTVRLWEVATGALLHTIVGHEDWVKSACFSPDGDTILSASDDDTVCLWDAATGVLQRKLVGHENWVNSASFSPDGTTIVSASSDETVRLWDATTGELIHTLSEHQNSVTSASFSPDGAAIVSASDDETVRLWDAATGKLLHTLSKHGGWVNSASFSPDGANIVSASYDNTVRLWDVVTGALLRTLVGHESWVNSASFSPDGANIVSASGDSTLRLWLTTESAPLMVIASLHTVGEWLAYKPGHLYYNCSLQGDEFAALRFNNELRDLYPLSWYRDQLKHDDWHERISGPLPDIRRRPLRRWWMDLENKALLLSLAVAIVIITTIFIWVLHQRNDPLRLAWQFFTRAGYTSIDRVTGGLLRLRGKTESQSDLAILWPVAQNTEARLTSLFEDLTNRTKLYLLYTEQKPDMPAIQRLRTKGREVIPLSSRQLEKHLLTLDATGITHKLRELEEPFVTRNDPYLEFKPIHDPTWFFGRDRPMQCLPAILAQGQHVGVFGLRKVGKTSLIQQIRQRFVSTPTVFIDCQAFEARADLFTEEILAQLHCELTVRQIKGIPPSRDMKGVDTSSVIRALFDCWQQSGQSEPFVLIFDEIDKLFVDRRQTNAEKILAEYVRLFSLLRGTAQSYRCLVTLVVGYRPDVNRNNLLTSAVGENPMWKSFQEEYLGFLSTTDSESMLTEIGGWKDISWMHGAAAKVYHYCGGHPLVTRFFASQACRQGRHKHVDLTIVEETARSVKKGFRRNDIGNYYKEGVWSLLSPAERQILIHIIRDEATALRNAIDDEALEEALVSLENFGLIRRRRDREHILTANLFQSWLQRRVG